MFEKKSLFFVRTILYPHFTEWMAASLSQVIATKTNENNNNNNMQNKFKNS